MNGIAVMKPHQSGSESIVQVVGALLEGSKQARLLKQAPDSQTVQLLKHMNFERDKILEDFDPGNPNVKSTVDSTA